MGTDIATGASGPTPDPVHPVDPSATPGVQRPGLIQMGQLDGPTIPAMDFAGFFAAVQGDAGRECEAALAPGMAAEDDRRGHYQGQQVPLGGQIGDPVDLPLVPDNAVPPAMSDLYPWPGLEPTPAGAPYGGDEPH